MVNETREPRGAGGVWNHGENAERETPELLEAIRRGDRNALERVARWHAPKLYRFALRLTGRREEAEELVQETLLRALPALQRFEGRSKLSTYLSRALGNLWKNRLRSRGRSRIVDWFRAGRGQRDESDTPELAAVDDGPSPFELLAARDRAEAIRRAVARLEPNRRWTLLLREVEDMSYEEIAETTGVAVGTVRSRLARAREELRALFEEEE